MTKKKERCVDCGKILPAKGCGWFSALCPDCLVKAKVKDALEQTKRTARIDVIEGGLIIRW